jgi:hypothetical protein
MFKFVLSDWVFIVSGAFVGALFGPEFSGPLWGSLILFSFGKVIQVGPGPTISKSWPKVHMYLYGFLLHLNDEGGEEYKNKRPFEESKGPSTYRIRGSALRRHPHGTRPRLSV